MTDIKCVSVIVRTCRRPHILREALDSIRKQTYRNIEVVVVEDGEGVSKDMLSADFADLNIKYFCTRKRVGRTAAGNIGLSKAGGIYMMFLDDDDLLFPQHVETLVNALEDSGQKAAYSVAYESVVKYDAPKGVYREVKRKIRFRQPFNRTFLCFNNYIPIQSVLFEHSLYERFGGFDETLCFLEDWDLWVRYSTGTDFVFVDVVTSLYRVPLRKRKRETELYHAYHTVTEKYRNYEMQTNVWQINQDLRYILDELKTPGWKKFLKRLRDKLFY